MIMSGSAAAVTAVAAPAGADARNMEGWLYLIRSNRFGLQYSRRRYFVLTDHVLKSFKYFPLDDDEDPVRSAPIDTCVRVTDNGRESIHRKVLFIFTLYSTAKHHDRLKLGADSSEEAAKWIRSLQFAASKEQPYPATNFVSCSKRRWPSLRICAPSRRSYSKSLADWTVLSSTCKNAITSDVIAPSPWKIFGCQNGLRLFREAKDWDSRGRHWDDHPAIMAVGVVDGTSEAIFRTLMSLGSSRSEWDFCFFRGSVIEHLDGHTDIIWKQLYSDWLPCLFHRGMRRRDLLLRRYWRREDDGTYVILYHSVFHKKCPPQKGYTRACLRSGGYVITPINQGKQSQVKHMLSMDWKFWKMYLRPAFARSMTICMLERIAALREMFKSKAGNFSGDFSSSELVRDIELTQIARENNKSEIPDQEVCSPVQENCVLENESHKQERSEPASLIGLNDASDEFFDVPEPVDYELENDWSIDSQSQLISRNTNQPKRTTAAALVQRLHELAGYMDLQELAWEGSNDCVYGTTLQNDAGCSMPCSWTIADPSTFLIRGETYLQDQRKIKAQSTLMQMIGADWLRSDEREDDLGGRRGGIVQRAVSRGGTEFFFIINIQVPGSSMYNLALYYVLKTPLEEHPLLHRFVNGDDAFRNSRFKLIPYISKGSWIVKQSVGKKACLVGQALEMNYFRGKNYLELGIDIGSSTVARGVVSLVLGYLNNLVIEMAFLVQGNAPDELPECLIGTCRLNHLDISKSVPVIK